jgi:hypothetical protein
VPIEDGGRGTHPVYATGFDLEQGRLVHWFDSPSSWRRGPGRYALLSTDLDATDVSGFCAVSAAFSGVPVHRLFLKRCPPDRVVKGGPVDDGAAYRIAEWTAEGAVVEWCYTDPVEAFEALGVTAEGVAMVEAAGLVDLSDRRRPFAA